MKVFERMQQNRVSLSGIVICILLIGSSVSFTLIEHTSAANSRAIYVKASYLYDTGDGSANRPYRSIQKAIDLAHDGDAIYVFEGVYNESLTINKQINITGLDAKNTTIRKAGVRSPYLIEITADFVALEDINISDTSGSVETALIHVNKADNIRIMGIKVNHVKNWGIYLDGSSDGIIGFSVIDNITHEGIHAVSSNNNVFSNNRFNKIGSIALSLNQAKNNIIYNNTFKDMTLRVDSGTAIDVFQSDNVNISKNTIRNCSLDGIRINGGSNPLIQKNTIKYCYSNGIVISASSSKILNNTLLNNQMGINLEGSSGKVLSNIIKSSNLIGLVAGTSTRDNIISLNQFIQNGVNAQEKGTNQWDFQGKGNYWDDYADGDRDHDGIGDSPYINTGVVDHYPTGKFLRPPKKPEKPSPADGKDNVRLSITLVVKVSDPDSQWLSVYFYNASNNELMGYQGGIKTNQNASCSFTLRFETTFSWYAVASDGNLENRSDIWFFTTRQIPPLNKKPVADPGGPYIAKLGQEITFDGSGSMDPDGSIIFYRWNFGDGSSEILDKAPEHTYADPGMYTVILTVVDNSGRSAIANTTATVSGSISENSPPVAMSGGPYRGEAGKPVLFNGSASYDQNGSLVSYSWNFGDGSLGSGVTPSHQYTKASTYLVTLTVTDNDGVTNHISTTVTITSVSMGILGVNPLFIGIAVILIIVAGMLYLFFRRRRRGEETEEEEQTEQ